MQSKLKYKVYGEFAQYEVNEIGEWIKSTIDGWNPTVLKITIDWDNNKDADV